MRTRFRFTCRAIVLCGMVVIWAASVGSAQVALPTRAVVAPQIPSIAVMSGRKPNQLLRYGQNAELAGALWGRAPDPGRRPPATPPDWKIIVWGKEREQTLDAWARAELVRFTVGTEKRVAWVPGLRRQVRRLPAPRQLPKAQPPVSRSEPGHNALTQAYATQHHFTLNDVSGSAEWYIHAHVLALLAHGYDLEWGSTRKEVALYLVEVLEELRPRPGHRPTARFIRLRWHPGILGPEPTWVRPPRPGEEMLAAIGSYGWSTVQGKQVIYHIPGQYRITEGLPYSPVRIEGGTTLPWARDLEPVDLLTGESPQFPETMRLEFNNGSVPLYGQRAAGMLQIFRWGRRMNWRGQYNRLTGDRLPADLAAGVRFYPYPPVPE